MDTYKRTNRMIPRAGGACSWELRYESVSRRFFLPCASRNDMKRLGREGQGGSEVKSDDGHEAIVDAAHLVTLLLQIHRAGLNPINEMPALHRKYAIRAAMIVAASICAESGSGFLFLGGKPRSGPKGKLGLRQCKCQLWGAGLIYVRFHRFM